MIDMVGEFLLDIVFSIVSGFLSLLPDTFQWSFEPGILGSFLSIIRSICYFLPMGTVGAIVGLIIWFGIFRIVIRFIKTIWDLLPLV